MSNLALPIDLPQLPQFRQLKAHLKGDAGSALLAWYVLWQQLAYRAQDGTPAGRLPGSDVATVVDALEDLHGAVTDRRALFDFFESPMKLLIRDGEDYVCPRFAGLNSHLSPVARSREQRGGDMKAFVHHQKKLEDGALELGLAVDGSKFKDKDGQPIMPEEARRAWWLISTCDNALFKPARPPYGFTEALIGDAVDVVRRHGDESIRSVARRLVENRVHPFVSGLTTERLLPQFGSIVAKLEPVTA